MNFLDFEPLQGALAGILFGLGVLLVAYIPKHKWLTASLICIAITPIALLPFWFSYGDLGISDWDYYFSMHSTLQKSISEFHQFPLWNPYVCGGTSALGDPEFPVFSPLFLFEIAFGTPAGFVLSIYASVAIGALGMLHLARKIGIGPVGALMASLSMAFGSVNLLEIVEGHPNILSAMYIPWVWYCWYSAYVGTTKQRKYFIIATAFLLALMFFQGGIYLLMYMTAAFITIMFLVKNPKRAITITLLAGILALGISSIKLIPVFYWLQQFQDTAYASSAYTLSSLDEILLGRHLHGEEDIIPNQGGGWHEYGAYIGPIVLLAALWGFIARRKERIARALLISATLAILVSAMGPYLKPLFDQMPFIPRSNISRVILFAIIPISLLAGYGVDAISRKKKYIRSAAVLIVTLAAIDLMSLAYPLASQAFVLPHTVSEIPPAPHPIAYSPFDYKIRHNGVDYTRAYDATRQGYGNMAYCSVLGPNPAVRIITDEGDNNIISFTHNENVSFKLYSWTPNTIIATVESKEPSSAVLNANYAKGWRINNKPAKEIMNRVGTDIPAGTTELTFTYKPPGMVAGITISALTIVLIIFLSLRK